MASLNDIGTEAAKAAPPAAVVGYAYVTDISLNQWVAIATLVYLALQAFFLIRNNWPIWPLKKPDPTDRAGA